MKYLKFHSKYRKSELSIADIFPTSRVLAQSCKFVTSLKYMLQDRFVLDLANKTIPHTLLAEAGISTAYQTALRDVQAIGGDTIHSTVQISRYLIGIFSSNVPF